MGPRDYRWKPVQDDRVSDACPSDESTPTRAPIASGPGWRERCVIDLIEDATIARTVPAFGPSPKGRHWAMFWRLDLRTYSVHHWPLPSISRAEEIARAIANEVYDHDIDVTAVLASCANLDCEAYEAQ